MSNTRYKIEETDGSFVLVEEKGALGRPPISTVRVPYSITQEAESGICAATHYDGAIKEQRKREALNLARYATSSFIEGDPSAHNLLQIRKCVEALITLSIAEMRKAAGASEEKQSSYPEMDHATLKPAEPDAHYGRAPCLSVSDCWLQPEKDGSRLQLIAHGTGLDITDFVTNMLFGSQVIPVRFSVSGKIKDDRLFEASEVNPEYASGRSLPVRQLRLSILQPAKSV